MRDVLGARPMSATGAGVVDEVHTLVHGPGSIPGRRCMTEFTVVARLLNPTEILVSGGDELFKWYQKNSVEVPGAEYTDLFKRGTWDGIKTPAKWCRLLSSGYEMRGSRGLLGRLNRTFTVKLTGAAPVSVQEVQSWIRQQLPTQRNVGQLRDYQRAAIEQGLTRRWGRVALATNAGKGAVMALMVRFAIDYNLPVLVLCDELAVFDALTEELMEWSSIVPEAVKQGVKVPPISKLCIAMVPTLARRIKGRGESQTHWRSWINDRAMVLLDEADKATAKTWRSILACAKHSHWRVGFSGTFPDAKLRPYEDLLLDQLMGGVFIRAGNKEMIERKVSAVPEVTLHSFDVTTTLTNVSWREWGVLRGPARRLFTYERAILNNQERHAYIASLVRPDIPTAIIVNRIEHGEQLALAIPEALFLDGSASEKVRRTALEAFAVGDVKILIVTKILDRGTNRLGHAADLIFASGEGSNRQTLQRIGRGLRRTGGKEFLRLVDIIDKGIKGSGRKKSIPERMSEFLHRAAAKRVRLYATEGFTVQIAK